MQEKPTFRKQLSSLISEYAMEHGSNTPDYILATFLEGVLINFDGATRERDDWYGFNPSGYPASTMVEAKLKTTKEKV